MLRQPEQRVLSAWYGGEWDHGASRYENACHGYRLRKSDLKLLNQTVQCCSWPGPRVDVRGVSSWQNSEVR